MRVPAAPQAAATSVIAVSDWDDEVVDLFAPSGAPIASISIPGIPIGVALDRSGNVYVDGGRRTALVYENDYKTLLLTLTAEGKYPFSIAVDKPTGIVAVTAVSYHWTDPSAVFFYRPGSSAPCKSLALPGGQFWGTFDNAGRYYVSGSAYPSSTTLVGVATGRCSATAIQPLSTANTLQTPQAIRISPAGNIAIFDRAGGNAVIYTYNAPVGNALGAPITTTPLGQLPTYSFFNGFAFTPDGTAVWFANPPGGVQKIPYPAGGLPVEIINVPNAADVVVGP